MVGKLSDKLRGCLRVEVELPNVEDPTFVFGRAPPPIHWRENNQHAIAGRRFNEGSLYTLLPRSAGKHYIVLLSLLYLHETIMLWINRAGYSRTTHRDTAGFLANWIRIESSSVVADISQSDPRVVADFFQTRRRKYLIKTYPDSCSLGLNHSTLVHCVWERICHPLLVEIMYCCMRWSIWKIAPLTFFIIGCTMEPQTTFQQKYMLGSGLIVASVK